ncbi:MAG: TRAP transporter small permease [Rhodospirillaceae bacterium]|nr:TRAP transporter small permease [Rhodospirillaceae bacterium]
MPDDEELSFRDLSPEGIIAFVIFWVLSGVVFLQFFSRYVLNDSIGWTEEIARYLLILVAFTGSVLGVQNNSHIFVEFFYRYLPDRVARVLSTLVDVARIAFLITASVITFKLARDTNQLMTSIEVSKSVIYYIVFAAFVAMSFRAVQLAWRHWRQGFSLLTRPGIGTTAD